MARRSEDKLDERFSELLRAKHEAGRRGAQVDEIEAELAELGRAWGLDAEELADAEATTARALGLVSEPLSRDSRTRGRSIDLTGEQGDGASISLA